MFSADNDGYELIFYIIAAVVGLVANAYRNYSKRKAQERNPGETSSPSFPDIFFEPVEETADEPEMVYSEPADHIDEKVELNAPAPAQDSEEEKSVFTSADGTVYSSEAVANMINKGHNAFAEISGENEGFDDDSISDSEIHDVEEDVIQEAQSFDLEEAVIYSEILKPKYFENRY